jgi:hypothetical protein
MTVLKCDLCTSVKIDRPARYNAKTKMGPWANLCEDHMESHGEKAKGLSSLVNVVKEQKLMGVKKSGSRWPEPTEPEPSMDELEAFVYDSVCPATDGCEVEPDGVCEHGHPSWLRKLSLI